MHGGEQRRFLALAMVGLLSLGIGAGCWGRPCIDWGLDGGEQFLITFVSGARTCFEASVSPLIDFRPGDSFVLTVGAPNPDCRGPNRIFDVTPPEQLRPPLSWCQIGLVVLSCGGTDLAGCPTSWRGQPQDGTIDRTTTVANGLTYRVVEESVCGGFSYRCFEWDITAQRINSESP